MNEEDYFKEVDRILNRVNNLEQAIREAMKNYRSIAQIKYAVYNSLQDETLSDSIKIEKIFKYLGIEK